MGRGTQEHKSRVASRRGGPAAPNRRGGAATAARGSSAGGVRNGPGAFAPSEAVGPRPQIARREHASSKGRTPAADRPWSRRRRGYRIVRGRGDVAAAARIVAAAVSRLPRGSSMVATQAAEGEQVCKDGTWDVVGQQMQILSVGIQPGQTVMLEPGSMMYMGPGVKVEANCDCPMGCCARCLGGEACAIMEYTNEGSRPTYVGVTPSVPADILALDLAQYDLIHARRGAFMSSMGGGLPGFECEANPLLCCCAGFGCCRQTISSETGQGTAFIQATGTVERKTLAAGETLVVDSYSLVAYHDAKLWVRPVGSFGACCCSGEGCCNTTVTGPGTAWVQSMPWELFRRHMGVVVQLDKNGNIKSVS
mmetsp:Transcript_30871/g.95516  ORF Transcript_30871/g.95516 Transcript_30871/m.95516 type:complete len:365 (+) Transcript_30871:128-1222(+)